MRNKLLLRVFLALVVFFSCTQLGIADDGYFARVIARAAGIPLSKPMPDTGIAAQDPPAGFVSFCLRFADQCASSPPAPSRINLSTIGWIELQNVNEFINRAIRPMSDLQHYGRPEFWTIPKDGFGDCEDYALTKRKILAKLGFSTLALRIAVVRTPLGCQIASNCDPLFASNSDPLQVSA